MLKTLLESNAKRERSQAITVASVTVHAVLIIIAACATAAGAAAVAGEEEPTNITWTTAPTTSGTIPPTRSPQPASMTSAVPNVAISIDVPLVIPAINATLAPVSSSDFQHYSGAATAVDTSSSMDSGGDRRAYTSNEVEVPVSPLGGARPDYPAALRSSGMEGQVVAQFIVDESGRGILESVNILSATNDMFAESVRRAIPKMRFSAARIGSRAVPQLVQQLFVFRLN